MQITARLTSDRKFSSVTTILAFWFSAFSILANAQTNSQGQNAVHNSSGGAVGSSAFIDASMFAGNVTNPNFCVVPGPVVLVVGPSSKFGHKRFATSDCWGKGENPVSSRESLVADTLPRKRAVVMDLL